MSTNTNTTLSPIADQVEAVSKLSDTSKKIRYLIGLGYKVAEIEKAFKVWGVTTKKGEPIRYQHIRNVAITPLTGK